MTTVSFHMEGNRIVGFTVKGHSGYAEAGSDIVCAAVTSAVRLVECAVNDVLGLEASVKVKERDASISLRLPGGLGQTAEKHLSDPSDRSHGPHDQSARGISRLCAGAGGGLTSPHSVSSTHKFGGVTPC